MKCSTNLLCYFLILFLVFNYSAQGQSPLDSSSTSTSRTSNASTETNNSPSSSCSGGHIDYPKCTKCSVNYESKNNTCVEIKNAVKPSGGTGRRLSLIFLACLLTVFLLAALLIIYIRLNQQHRHRLPANSGNAFNPNVNSRFNNFLRSIGLNNFNKNGRFNFFSISNNNNNNNSSLGEYRQPDTSRSHFNENPDEALLFDDPYADGGLNNSSANPYKSLTLAVT